MRVAEGLSVLTGGTLTNSKGQQNEAQTYRQPASWMDCSGKIGRQTCGIAVFDHPQNPAYPTPWFTRNYGIFSPNYGLFQEEPIEITPTSPLHLRYRIYTHNGDVLEGKVQEAWETWIAEIGE